MDVYVGSNAGEDGNILKRRIQMYMLAEKMYTLAAKIFYLFVDFRLLPKDVCTEFVLISNREEILVDFPGEMQSLRYM